MSNCLTIIVTEFRSVVDNVATYGYTARDSYGYDFEDGYDTLAEFLEKYPNAQALIAHVKMCMDIGEDSVTSVWCSFPE